MPATISDVVHSDLRPFDLNCASPVTVVRVYMLTEFEVFKVFRFRVNQSHGTDRQTDGHGATLLLPLVRGGRE